MTNHESLGPVSVEEDVIIVGGDNPGEITEYGFVPEDHLLDEGGDYLLEADADDHYEDFEQRIEESDVNKFKATPAGMGKAERFATEVYGRRGQVSKDHK